MVPLHLAGQPAQRSGKTKLPQYGRTQSGYQRTRISERIIEHAFGVLDEVGTGSDHPFNTLRLSELQPSEHEQLRQMVV